MNTNRAYEGLHHPMKEVEGGFVPDFNFRYLSEDVPTGLIFSKGVADLLDVKTPTITDVLRWCQKVLGKEFLLPDGRVGGKDIGETRAPQTFGIETRRDLIQFLKLDK